MDIAELVQRSRQEQGLGPSVTSASALARIAELIALDGATRKRWWGSLAGPAPAKGDTR